MVLPRKPAPPLTLTLQHYVLRKKEPYHDLYHFMDEDDDSSVTEKRGNKTTRDVETQ